MSPPLTPEQVVAALAGRPATLDLLAVRLKPPHPDDLLMAVEEAAERGLVAFDRDPGCDADGICSTSAPALVRPRLS